MAEIKKQCAIEYRKSMQSDDPVAYVEATLRFEGLMDARTEELHRIFNKFYERVEAAVHKETDFAHRSNQNGNETKKRRVLTYKDGRPSFEDKEV